MKKKYVLRPGRTQEENGQTYQVNAHDLANLYRVKLSECVVLQNNDPLFDRQFSNYIASGYIFLHPRSDKNYSWLKN